MLYFNDKTGEITATNGGYSKEGLKIRDEYVQLSDCSNFQRGMFYEPEIACEKSKIGIVIVHAEADYSTFNICGEMAKRGYRTLGANVSDRMSTLDDKMIDIGRCVKFLRSYPGVEKVVLMGHSGGATLMTAYQRAAENGISSLQGDDMLIKLSLTEELDKADGLMLLDSNWGNGAMTLFSIDPAIIDYENGMRQNPEYNYFSKESGYDGQDTCYTQEFLKKYFKGQAKRNNDIVYKALDRLEKIEKQEGNYLDDEPFEIAGTSQIRPCNRLIPQDRHLFEHTKEKYNLVHSDGSVTNEIIHSLRNSSVFSSPSSFYRMGTAMGTVRMFLTEHAVFAKNDYALHEDCATGIDWDHTYNCPPGNIKHITVPLLCIGMTGSYEYLASEIIYENSISSDKNIAFIEGAEHNFYANTEAEKYPGQFGDTEKLLFDCIDHWLAEEKRFID